MSILKNWIIEYHINSKYTVDWDENPWRLPNAGINPSSGYHNTASEMGHLFYTEMEFKGYDAGEGIVTPEELNSLIFSNLDKSAYWLSTEYTGKPDNAWLFSMSHGFQWKSGKNESHIGLAIRNAHVSEAPVPGAMWLLGTGLVGVIGLKRKTVQQS